MPAHFDTIIAPITGPGPAPVTVVRMSGPDAWSIALRLAQATNAPLEPRFAHYRTLATGDDGYLILFEHGRSYTGEESAEISIHGSRASAAALLEFAKSLGARYAEAGEFTQRAFMNGRIDLTEAEAVRDTIEAETSAQLRLANTLRQGALHRTVSEIVDELIGVLAGIEASVDFSEETGPLDSDGSICRMTVVVRQIDELLATAEVGRIIRHGLRIAIVGPPNAGKSSLLNQLLGHDRAIVTPIPGTTRDYVEERADFDGLPVVLVDTAGLRETNDLAESIGVQRSRAIAAEADLVWFVSDASDPVQREDWPFDRPVVWIANKIDLADAPAGFAGFSCTTGQGIDALIESVKPHFDNPRSFAIQDRHAVELVEAREDLDAAKQVLQYGRPPDLASVGLRNAIRSLGRITGETAEADMIARIFRDFCIGK